MKAIQYARGIGIPSHKFRSAQKKKICKNNLNKLLENEGYKIIVLNFCFPFQYNFVFSVFVVVN